jgi:undecaprenyl-diphosphatase
MAEAFSKSGDAPLYEIIAGTVALAVLIPTRRASLAMLVLLAAGLRMIATPLKELTGRDRPPEGLVTVSDHAGGLAFPSGHVLGSTLMFGVLMYVIEVSVPGVWQRRALQAACTLLIVSMGYARIETGAHWPTDVVGAWAIGVLLVVALIVVHNAAPAVELRRLARIRIGDGTKIVGDARGGVEDVGDGIAE